MLGSWFYTILMHIKPLSTIIDLHSITQHSLVDDTITITDTSIQLRMSATPNISKLFHSMQSNIHDMKTLAPASMLKHNGIMTKLMLVASKATKHQHNLPTSITIGNAHNTLKQLVNNLKCHLTI